MARDRLDTRDHGRRYEEQPPPAQEPPLLDLQRSAGNAAVAGLIQRKLIRDASNHVTDVEFTVDTEISLNLATKAQGAVAGGVSDAELRTLRTEADSDATINDNERMFLAGLLDAGNASAVAGARIATGTKFTFARATIEAHMAHARDIDQPVKDPTIATEEAAAQRAGGLDEFMAHETAAMQAVLKQMRTLVGSAYAGTLSTIIGFTIGKPAITLEAMLETMIAAASDDTQGDRTMAALVYAVAVDAGHPMAGAVHAGQIKIDQVTSASLGRDFAGYRGTAGRGEKGDTLSVQVLDINNVAHRAAVVHELTHAAQDAAATGTTVQTTARDQAELEAYRAGARYELEQAAPLQWGERITAMRNIGGLMNEILMMAMVLESRAKPAEYEPVIREANIWWSGRLPDVTMERLLRVPDARITPVVLKSIRQAYGAEDASGNPIPGGNDLPIDKFSGEGILDWVDRT